LQPSGRFLYVSKRGHDSIACFAVNAGSGRLTTLGQQPTEQTPRVFGIDPSGSFLYAAGQSSGKLAAYRIDPSRGALHALQVYDVGARPLWVLAISF
jgi:6-phosphogluconolactonase